MSTQVGRLAKNRIVRDMNGSIIDWFNEKEGGWIIQKRQIVNVEAWNRHMQIEKDKQESAKAVSQAKVREDYPENKPGENGSDKIKELDERVTAMDTKLDAILKAISK
jgi:hypothetical protein